MTARKTRADREPVEQPADPARSVLTPITQLPHLAAAAERLGQQDRLIRVELPEPTQVRTPGRRAGQWLASGELLSGPGSGPVNAFAAAAQREQQDREQGWER